GAGGSHLVEEDRLRHFYRIANQGQQAVRIAQGLGRRRLHLAFSRRQLRGAAITMPLAAAGIARTAVAGTAARATIARSTRSAPRPAAAAPAAPRSPSHSRERREGRRRGAFVVLVP